MRNIQMFEQGAVPSATNQEDSSAEEAETRQRRFTVSTSNVQKEVGEFVSPASPTEDSEKLDLAKRRQLFEQAKPREQNTFQGGKGSGEIKTRSPATGTLRSFGGGGDRCATCSKTVYVKEKLAADGKVFHKTCFRYGCNPNVEI